MNLTEERVKIIIAKVHNDLLLPHIDKYPIIARFIEKDNSDNEFEFAIWNGGYNYSDPESVGEDYLEIGIGYIIIINDKKGEAIQYSNYTGHWLISLNEKGKYERLKQLGR